MKRFIPRIYHWEFFWLTVIVIVTAGMHASIINEVKVPILDEVYYAGYYPQQQGDLHYGSAYSILSLHSDPRPEHPPLAKLIIAGGIVLFGDNNIGWRIPSILFGTLSIILLFFICRKLGLSQRATDLATFLFAFENLCFLFSSIAMLDVFFVTLMLASFLIYLYRRPVTYFASGVFIGLSALAKLDGALSAPVIFVHWLFSKGKKSYSFLLTAIMAPAVFVGLLPVFDYAITGKLENPIARIQEMLSLAGSLTFANVTYAELSRPWQWLLNYRPMPFWYTPHYTAAISPSIWVVMVPLVLYLIYRSVKQRNEAALFALSWFFGTFLLWIPGSIITNRISYVFYFYPTIGALCVGLGLGLNEAWEWATIKRRQIKIPLMAGVVTFLLFHVASFVILTPVFFRG